MKRIASPVSIRIHVLSLACAVMLGASAASSQATRAEVPGSSLTVYLVTMGVGDDVWAKFGHNAIWIRDPKAGIDIAFNWGLFDFRQSDFIPRLARGNMLYSMAGFDMQDMLREYVATNRSVWAQELNLTLAQRLEVLQRALTNALPQNRFYTYDYYRDNCSTRPRDLLDSVLGGVIKSATANQLTNTTYRWHTQRLLADDPAPYFGIMLSLGHPADRKITKWEEMFLPLKLREYLREVSVRDSTGKLQPLVKSEVQVFAAHRAPENQVAPNYTLPYTVVGILIAAFILALGFPAERGSRVAIRALGVVIPLWALFAGLAGTGLVLAWTATNHVFMYRNENLLQFNPLPLALVVLVPLALFRNRTGAIAARVAAVIAGLSLLGFLIQVLPWFHQPNGEIIGLALPPNLAVAYALARWNRSKEILNT